jgi:quinol monooxygenase YgiN
MACVLLAKWIAREGYEEEVAEAIRALIEPTRAEPGNLFYQPHRDPDDPRVFVFYEQYEDEAALEAHRASDHFKQHALDRALPVVETREWTLLEPVGSLER